MSRPRCSTIKHKPTQVHIPVFAHKGNCCTRDT